jgi:negative regulator of sigma E activity
MRPPEVSRLTASAMWSPVRSWRTMMVRMSASAAASMTGFTG